MEKVLRKAGRPPGRSTYKLQIIDAAKQLFENVGYDGTTIRAIAKQSEVDPALVLHYFDSKQGLYIASMTPSQRLPYKIAKELRSGDIDTLGLRLAGLFVGMMESKLTNHIIVNSLKAAVHIPGASSILKSVLVKPILKVFKESSLSNAELKATLCQSQLVGIVLTRYILKIEPLASLSADELVAYLAPTLQRYLTDELIVKN